MSKGAGAIAAMLEVDQGISEFLPSSWWNCSLNLRRAIGKSMTGWNATSRDLVRDIRSGDTRIQSSRVIQIPLADGALYDAAIIGRLSPEGRARYCWRDSGVLMLESQDVLRLGKGGVRGGV